MLFLIIKGDGKGRICTYNFQDKKKFSEIISSLNDRKENGDDFDFLSFFTYALQALMYLCAKNCEIEENPKQKNIYHPDSRIKDQYREIRMWDVAYRVSREYEKSKHQAAAGSPRGKDRSPVRMHWRRAHWHTYWTGPGRSVRELKFLAPCLVNENDDVLPIVEHEKN